MKLDLFLTYLDENWDNHILFYFSIWLESKLSPVERKLYL